MWVPLPHSRSSPSCRSQCKQAMFSSIYRERQGVGQGSSQGGTVGATATQQNHLDQHQLWSRNGGWLFGAGKQMPSTNPGRGAKGARRECAQHIDVCCLCCAVPRLQTTL
jgi:hypothetical protein